MMLSRVGCRLGICFVGALWLISAACSTLEKRIDQVAGGQNVPADTAVGMRPEHIEETRADPPPTPADGPIKITIQEAILLALENNRALTVERLSPDIKQTLEDQQRALFDPQLEAQLSLGRLDGKRLSTTTQSFEGTTADTVEGALSLEQFFPTGTTLSLEGAPTMADSSLYGLNAYSARLGMSVTQALLRGYGPDVNLVRLRQARLDTRFSEYELRGFSESLLASVEKTYWDYVLARRRIEIFEESLKLARQQLNDTEEIIRVGKMAEAELAAVQAELASQEQGLINARSSMQTTRLKLLQLLNPPGSDLWNREVYPIHQPVLPEIKLDDVGLHVAVARRMRADLNEARLGVLRDDLELVNTKNGLLPVLDLFITLGKTGYADSFGGSISNISKDNYDAQVGARFEYPFSNRRAKARHQQALLSREQAQKALQNISQLVDVDVRSAYIEVNRSKQQISASSATRKFDAEKLRIETEKFLVGRSTNFLVARAQRDLLTSRIAEVQAVANYLKALIDLFRLDGSLLERRGISAPGRKPVEIAKQNNF